jgi:glycosyltransferase involved in cell wall biosynthesis
MICVSDGIKESFVRNGIDNSKCIVVHNGIDTGLKPALKPVQIKQEYKIKEKELLIGAVGSLMKRKRFHDLIRAISYVRSQKSGVRDQELKNTTNKIKCIIVGEGPERESLQKEINKHGLQESVILAGFKPDAISYINAFDIFVLPSEREGFPRVLLEAMLMKKPVIASRIAGPSELVIDKETGFLFQKGNIKELASYIVTLLSLPQRRIYMGNRGRRHVVENFAIEKYIAQVNQVFSEVIE